MVANKFQILMACIASAGSRDVRLIYFCILLRYFGFFNIDFMSDPKNIGILQDFAWLVGCKCLISVLPLYFSCKFSHPISLSQSTIFLTDLITGALLLSTFQSAIRECCLVRKRSSTACRAVEEKLHRSSCRTFGVVRNILLGIRMSVWLHWLGDGPMPQEKPWMLMALRARSSIGCPMLCIGGSIQLLLAFGSCTFTLAASRSGILHGELSNTLRNNWVVGKRLNGS